MINRSTDHLVKLIRRLTPVEKRQFRITVNKNNSGKGEILFLSLFDHIDKYKDYDEAKILKQIPGIKKQQLANIKSHLYKQLLSNLRSQKRNTFQAIQIRESLDYALVLQSKGLHNAALDILEKTKKLAQDNQRSLSTLAALEIEKHIESLYITGSMYPKAKLLRQQTKEAMKHVSVNHQLSNMSLSLYGFYLQYGYVKDGKDFEFITDYFNNYMPDVTPTELDIPGRLLYHQSHVWYFTMTQDFPNIYRHAQRWVDIFHVAPEWQEKEPIIYLKGLHNILIVLFMAQRYDKFAPAYEELLQIGDKRYKKMDLNNKSVYKMIEFTHGINQFFLTGNFVGGTQYVDQIAQAINTNEFDWDLNRIILFHYKIASIYFCHDDLDKTILHLHKITNQVYPEFREDIQCFARILNLIAHFELGNDILVSHQLKSTYRYLSKIQQLQPALQMILTFLRRTPRMSKSDIHKEFVALHEDLVEIRDKQYERRPFLYLDIISWLESKIQNRSVGEIIREKAIDRQKQK